ncbi:hypothetical protein GCM10025864_03870 [Luteimicrobium album]|uniref:Uncharacterized protein n=1 Tax=Luteimicrobium album TaxID=1054550 RepID=A0ABQ6HY75_9MICO|nr:hypothetical protein GCM10025864_03870 [Luteimicrobium album]
MSSSVTVRPVRGVRGIGLFAIIVGIIMILAGGTTYGMVTSQLRDENITVSDDAQFLAGWRVQDPLTAYSQAEVINKHALAMTDGQTYAQLPQDDPRRATVMNASFLRASLFTSVVAFGVAVLVVVLGVLFLLVGIALRRLGKGEVSVLDVVPASQAASAGPVAPAAPVVPAQPVTPARPTETVARVVPPERTSSRHAAPAEAVAPTPVQQPAPPVAESPTTAEPEPPATPSAAPRGPLPTEPETPSAGTDEETAVQSPTEAGPMEPAPTRLEDGTAPEGAQRASLAPDRRRASGPDAEQAGGDRLVDPRTACSAIPRAP